MAEQKSGSSISQSPHELFVLDACALITYFNDEPGAESAERLIERARSGDVSLYTTSVNVYETYYDALRSGAPEKALELLNDVYGLPLVVVERIDPTIMQHAGAFKTKYKMSLADSLALGLAEQLDAKVVTTDHHEFDSVEKSGDMKFFWLR